MMRKMIKLLDDQNSPGLSAILKCTVYWAIFLLLLFIAGTQLTVNWPVSWYPLSYGILGSLAALLATFILIKTEGKTFSAYGLTWDKQTLPGFFKGLFLGSVILLLIILILVTFTDLQIKENYHDWKPITSFGLLSILPLAFMEEIAFRAYPFQKLNRAFGIRTTQILVALVFAAYHMLQGWNVQLALWGPGIWALVFGLAAIQSKGIALPTGIHVALNLIQTIIGMKGNKSESIWLLQHSENATPHSIAFSETMGLLTQILVLVCAVILTELYIRKSITEK